MRNIVVLLLLILCFSSTAQDLIQKKDGEVISVKVIEITPVLVKYLKSTLPDSPIYSIYKTEVKMIAFLDGTKEVFDNPIEENVKPITSIITDTRDNQKYEIVKIGQQLWFSENLSFHTSGSWCYDENPLYCEKYGRLYAFKSALYACPNGWHLPSDEEWKKLEIELGMIDNVDEAGWRGNPPGQGRLLKKGFSGFNAEFGGRKREGYNYSYHGGNKEAYFWTSSKYNRKNKSAWIRFLNHRASIMRTKQRTKNGLSVRCIKDK